MNFSAIHADFNFVSALFCVFRREFCRIIRNIRDTLDLRNLGIEEVPHEKGSRKPYAPEIFERLHSFWEIHRASISISNLRPTPCFTERFQVKFAEVKHVDLVAGSVYQDAREVRTKFAKTFTTFFFPVGDDVREIVADWLKYLRNEKLWGNDDPVFPATQIGIGATHQFEVIGLKREHWSNTTPIRTIFRDGFESAGLQYFNPHTLRNTLARLGETICQTPEDFKAWSQNIGHEKVLTTFSSYGVVSDSRQGEIIHGLARPKQPAISGMDELADAIVRKMRNAVLE